MAEVQFLLTFLGMVGTIEIVKKPELCRILAIMDKPSRSRSDVRYYFNRKRGYFQMMMKSTGIVRKVDELGRVVIPIELRRTLGIGEKDALEIYVDGERIMLKKYEPACIFCGNAENVTYFKGKIVCRECLKDLPSPVTN
jgi:transcriptional pleiotropic regulator of transition state genes